MAVLTLAGIFLQPAVATAYEPDDWQGSGWYFYRLCTNCGSPESARFLTVLIHFDSQQECVQAENSSANPSPANCVYLSSPPPQS